MQFLELTGSPANYMIGELALLIRLAAIECYQADGLEVIEMIEAIVGKCSDGDDNTEDLE